MYKIHEIQGVGEKLVKERSKSPTISYCVKICFFAQNRI
jgi:hypothetical protein